MQEIMKQQPKFICVVDTETTGIGETPYMYDLGYIIARYNEETKQYHKVEERQFIIEQVYNNKMLFESAYYGEKRPKYTSLLKGRKARMKHMGHALNKFRNDLEKYGVEQVWAYNMPFDKRVLKFNSERFNIINPIENIQELDIMGIACKYIHKTEHYNKFCVDNEFVTDTNNISTNAEVTYRYLINEPTFIEDHMGLQDARIELDILNKCLELGGNLNATYKREFIQANQMKEFKVEIREDNKVTQTLKLPYGKKTWSKKYQKMILSR